MSLPDLSFSRSVGQWRYIQSLHETGERRNPDELVGQFLPRLERWKAKWIQPEQLAALRSNRFYYYLVARTRYYDAIFLQAIERQMQYIINVGCGTDTRSHRFRSQLERHGLKVCECDRESLIHAKERHCRRRWSLNRISYLPLELNDSAWPEFESWLERHVTGSVLVLMEGVTPYVNQKCFGDFLDLLAGKLRAGSRVAYDFKIAGVNDSFGRDGQTELPFRLPGRPEEVAHYHKTRHYELIHMERSDDLSLRLIPSLAKRDLPLFEEDVLLQLEVARQK